MSRQASRSKRLVFPNPSWTNEVLALVWDETLSVFGRDLMPSPEASGDPRREFKEFGCGAYGCVIPSETMGIVIKVTTDETEARFAEIIRQFGDDSGGIVRYHAVYEAPFKYQRERVYVLWRQEAYGVGHIESELGSHVKDSVKSVRTHLSFIREWAHQARVGILRADGPERLFQDLSKWKFRDPEKTAVNFNRMGGSEKIAAAISIAKWGADRLAKQPLGEKLGAAISYWIDQKILLADVHSGNIGVVYPDDTERYEVVVTDPGHATTFTTKFDSVRPKALGDAAASDWV